MEFKADRGKEQLGLQQPAKISSLHSPVNGIKEVKKKDANNNVIILLKERLGLKNWHENV